MLNKRLFFKEIEKIYSDQLRTPALKIESAILKKGLTVSTQAMSSIEDIALTPYTRNMLLSFDKIDDLKVGAPETKMERYITKKTLELLKKYCGSRRTEYNHDLDPGDPDHYSIDCGRNFKSGKEIRHVVPGMNEQRKKAFAVFTKSKPELDASSLFKLQSFNSALDQLGSGIPNVRSSDKGLEVNLPFMNKHTNVGYPYFRNDRLVDPKTGKTYGELTSDVAKKLQPRSVVNLPFTAFGRNLRQKARPILGGSRIQALVFNQLERPEIECYKEQSPLFIGYNDDKIIKEKLVKLAKGLSDNRRYTVMNRDFAAFDTTISPTLRRIIGAFTYLKTIDERGRDICHGRSVSQYRSQLINGLENKCQPIYGRIFSGEIDTNAGGGKINALATLTISYKLDPALRDAHNAIVKSGSSPLGVMGDDNLLVQSKDMSDSKYSSEMKDIFGLDVSSSKGEYGLFFLQRRLIKRGSDYIMLTPFTRVIRSFANKEMRKGLGPAGGTLASYMLLSQLIEGPELMLDVAKIFAPYDEYRLGTVGSVKQLTKLVSQEDEAAKLKDGRRSQSTYAKLFDGDPLKSGGFKDDGSVNESLVSKIHKMLSSGLRQ